jgi:hypothetical protein
MKKDKKSIVALARKDKKRSLATARLRMSGKTKKLKPESIAWYKQEWLKMTKGIDVVSDSFLTGLAQLSYENKHLRKRVAALEAIMLAQMLGRVEIRGDMHLMECAKRQDPEHACTCGSTPDEERGNSRRD